MRGKRLVEERVCPGILRPPHGGQQAEDQDCDVTGRRVALEPATKCQAVELGDENLGDDDGGAELAGELEGLQAVLGEGDPEARFS